MELFANTLYINLKHRVDRNDHIADEFEKMGIQGERVDAFYDKVGAVGCTKSHIHCLELAIERGYSQVFICEDDITFLEPATIKKTLVEFNESHQDDWDVLFISGNNVPPFRPVDSTCVQVFYCQCTCGYIVNQHYFETLLANFKESLENLVANPERKGDFSLDMYWKRLQMIDRWLFIIPPTVVQWEGYSDVEKRDVDYKMDMLDLHKSYLL